MLKFLIKSRKVLGVNARNLRYIRPNNPKRAIRLVNNKLRTKKRLARAGLPTPNTFAVIKTIKELNEFDWNSLPKSFTLKPNHGIGGRGVLVVFGEKTKKTQGQKYWITAGQRNLNINDISGHILNILDGHCSKLRSRDIAFFEERIKLVKQLRPYVKRGIPDVRVIVYNKIPVMAELRLPTPESQGRSNLHLGGIGVGLDLGSGITTTAIHRDKIIEYLPGSRLLLRGVKIPYWKSILGLASECQNVIGLGFFGIDIAIDREKGPMILEINARPGLSIQIANLAPLEERLKRVEGLKIASVKRAVRVAQNLFGGEVEEELEEISGKKIIGIHEQIDILDREGNKHSVKVKVDTGAYKTSIGKTLAEKLNLMDKVIGYGTVRGSLGEEERPIIRITFVLDNEVIETEAYLADRSQMKYDAIIGRRDLNKFLIDPDKKRQ